MKDKKFIEENNFDESLNGLFLAENAELINENLARFVVQQEYDLEFDSDKEKKLIRKLEQDLKGRSGYLNFFIIALVLLIAGIGGVMLYNKPATVNSVQSENKIAGDQKTEPAMESTAPSVQETTSAAATSDSISASNKEATESKKKGASTLLDLMAEDVAVYYPQSGVGSKSAATFFKFSEKDFVFYSKVKKKMLERLLTADKETYASVEEGEISYRGNSLLLYPYTLRNQAITNLEYKVFLAELIRNGRSDEFKKAVVRNETWLNYNDNILATTYFFDEKYNDFPVVNISPLAAFLFCDWLEKELNQFAQHANPQAELLKIRLPFDSEWILATGKGYMQVADCGGFNTIYDSKEGITDISILKKTALNKKDGTNKKTELDELFLMNRYGMNEDKTLQLFQKGFNYKSNIVTDSLYPNKMEVFGKVAHVSEIVLEQGTSNVIIVGGCWKNKQEYMNMLKEFKKTAASPFVGFRIVMVTGAKTRL